MAEPPRPSQVIDVPTDADALIRLAMTPPPAQRQKRHYSVHTPSSAHSSTSVLSEPIQSPEELLISTLAAIEGDEMSYDVFQFVIEMVRVPQRHLQNFCLGNALVCSFLRLYLPLKPQQ